MQKILKLVSLLLREELLSDYKHRPKEGVAEVCELKRKRTNC